MKTSEILDKAADQIERYGWIQEDWYVPGPEWTECRVCAGGGINAAAGFVPDYDEHDGTNERVVRAFMALAEQMFPNELIDGLDDAMASVTAWNDEDDRTAEEVVRELRAAAASEREAGR